MLGTAAFIVFGLPIVLIIIGVIAHKRNRRRKLELIKKRLAEKERQNISTD